MEPPKTQNGSDYYRILCIIISLFTSMVILEAMLSLNTSILGYNGISISSSLSFVSHESDLTIQYVRTAICVELSRLPIHITQLHAFLYSSWLFVNSLSNIPIIELIKHPQINLQIGDQKIIESVKLDLLIFCEPESCDKIPLTCHPLEKLYHFHDTLDPMEFKKMDAWCYYYKLDDEYEDRAMEKGNSYRFLTSLLFLIEEPCISIINYYDYVLRSDVDTFLTPLSLVWIPKSINNNIPLLGAFGDNYMGSNFTDMRLEHVANKLNLRHAGLYQTQRSAPRSRHNVDVL